MIEKVPIVRPRNTCVVRSFVRVSSWDGEPLADVDMSSGERLSVQWPCRVEFVTIGGGVSQETRPGIFPKSIEGEHP